jgi:Tfp pilus assembly protein PilX
MCSKQKIENSNLLHSLKNQNGFLLIAALMLLATLTILGTTAFILSRTDIKIGGGFRNSQQAFQAAQAGIERGREVLRKANGDQTWGADTTLFNSELVHYAGGALPVTSGTSGGYTYTVFLSNDAGDAGATTSDSNNKVMLTSTATGPNNTKAIVEIAVSLPPPPVTPPVSFPTNAGTISLLGNSASFIGGGNSNAKSYNGDDQCGSAASIPVVAVSNSGSLPGIKTAIDGTKPKTYHTKVNGVSVDASTNMDDVAKSMTTAQMTSAGYNLNDAASLNALVNAIQASAGAVTVPSGQTSVSGGLGTAGHPRIIVANGDFTMGGSGFGILVVKGQLTFNGNVDFTGIIMVIGQGIMMRNGGGNGTISGAIWVANTAGADGIVGNVDDAMGAAVLNTSGGGNSNVQYCSSAISDAINQTTTTPTYSPLLVKSFRQVL